MTATIGWRAEEECIPWKTNSSLFAPGSIAEEQQFPVRSITVIPRTAPWETWESWESWEPRFPKVRDRFPTVRSLFIKVRDPFPRSNLPKVRSQNTKVFPRWGQPLQGVCSQGPQDDGRRVLPCFSAIHFRKVAMAFGAVGYHTAPLRVEDWVSRTMALASTINVQPFAIKPTAVLDCCWCWTWHEYKSRLQFILFHTKIFTAFRQQFSGASFPYTSLRAFARVPKLASINKTW